MSWEQRLRDMILAGGALAAGACSTSPTGASSDASTLDVNYFDVDFCCNANPDPCCSCDVDAAPSPACQIKMACEAEGGAWPNYAQACSYPDAAASEAAGDAGDASSDVSTVDVIRFSGPDGAPCCNANPDPCCSCDVDAAPSAACQLKTGCEAEGGAWDYSTQACSSNPDAAASDADAGNAKD